MCSDFSVRYFSCSQTLQFVFFFLFFVRDRYMLSWNVSKAFSLSKTLFLLLYGHAATNFRLSQFSVVLIIMWIWFHNFRNIIHSQHTIVHLALQTDGASDRKFVNTYNSHSSPSLPLSFPIRSGFHKPTKATLKAGKIF